MKKITSAFILIAICISMLASCGIEKSVSTTQAFDAEKAFAEEVLAYSISYIYFGYKNVNYVGWWAGATHYNSFRITVNGNRYTGNGKLRIRDTSGRIYSADVTAVYYFDESDNSFDKVKIDISTPQMQ